MLNWKLRGIVERGRVTVSYFHEKYPYIETEILNNSAAGATELFLSRTRTLIRFTLRSILGFMAFRAGWQCICAIVENNVLSAAFACVCALPRFFTSA